MLDGLRLCGGFVTGLIGALRAEGYAPKQCSKTDFFNRKSEHRGLLK